MSATPTPTSTPLSATSTPGSTGGIAISTPVCETSDKKKEICKKELVALARMDMAAQTLNLKYNDLNKVLLAEIRRAETKWQGGRGLKKFDQTDENDARNNMAIADMIVDSPNVTKLYGEYRVGDHGVFVLNRGKAKLLLGRKLSQQRKPSAYKRKLVLNECDGVSDENKKVKQTIVPSQAKPHDPVLPRCFEEILEKESNKENNYENGEIQHESEKISEYEKQRLAKIAENNLVMLDNDILPRSMGVLAALFYLRVKKLADTSVSKLKELTATGMKLAKGTIAKEELAFLLGKELLAQGKLKRIDMRKPIARDNLAIS